MIKFVRKKIRIFLDRYKDNKYYLDKIKLLEEEILDLNEKIMYLDRIISLLPGNIFWKNKEREFLGCNNNVSEILKLKSPKDIIGKTNKDLFDYKLAIDAEEADFRVIKEKHDIFFEEVGVDSKGNTAYYFSHKAPLINLRGDMIGILGVSVDITERKKLEQELVETNKKLEIANQIKNEFIMSMSHDIRTPFSGIAEIAKILKKKEKDKEKLELLTIIEQSSDQLLHLLNDILEIVEIGSESFPVRREKINLEQIMLALVGLEAAQAKGKGLDINFEYPESIPKWFISDSLRIRRILINLIGNSIKFTQSGSVSIIVKILEEKDSKLVLEITVKDTGIGIPEDKLEYVFQGFSKLNSKEAGKHKGNGLGMRIAKNFAEDLGGSIKLESKLGVGTEFHVIIPMEVVDEAEVLKSIESAKIKSEKVLNKEQKKCNALFVEDEPVCQVPIKFTMQELGHDFDIIGSTQGALRLLEEKHFDIVFTDIGLPDGDGISLTKKILETRNIPVIGMSAHLPKSKQQSCLDAGMKKVITKPISDEDISDILYEYID